MSNGLWLQVGERLRGTFEALIAGVEFQQSRLEEMETRLSAVEKAQAEQQTCRCELKKNGTMPYHLEIVDHSGKSYSQLLPPESYVLDGVVIRSSTAARLNIQLRAGTVPGRNPEEFSGKNLSAGTD